MSLSLFALRNKWHKNGTRDLNKESGGLQKLLIVLLVKKPMIRLESNEECFQTNFTIFVNKCSTESILRAQISRI